MCKLFYTQWTFNTRWSPSTACCLHSPERGPGEVKVVYAQPVEVWGALGSPWTRLGWALA